MWFCLWVEVLFSPHIPPIPNIKTCSFLLHFPFSQWCLQRKRRPTLPPLPTPISWFANAFVKTASRTLVSVQIPMKKIEMTFLGGGKKTSRKNPVVTEPRRAWLNSCVWHIIFSSNRSLPGLPVNTTTTTATGPLRKIIWPPPPTEVTSSCALLFSGLLSKK